MNMQYPRILFFIAGPMPTLEDQLAAEQLAPCRVSFRNAQLDDAGYATEKCDGWYGDATPKRYKKTYPTAEVAAKKYTEDRAEFFAAKAAGAEAAQALAAQRQADEKLKDADKATKIAEAATKAAEVKAADAANAVEAAKAVKGAAKQAAKAATEGNSPTVANAAGVWSNNA